MCYCFVHNCKCSVRLCRVQFIWRISSVLGGMAGRQLHSFDVWRSSRGWWLEVCHCPTTGQSLGPSDTWRSTHWPLSGHWSVTGTYRYVTFDALTAADIAAQLTRVRSAAKSSRFMWLVRTVSVPFSERRGWSAEDCDNMWHARLTMPLPLLCAGPRSWRRSIGLIRFLAGWRKRLLNHALVSLRLVLLGYVSCFVSVVYVFLCCNLVAVTFCLLVSSNEWLRRSSPKRPGYNVSTGTLNLHYLWWWMMKLHILPCAEKLES